MTVDITNRDPKTFYCCRDHCRQKFLAMPTGANRKAAADSVYTVKQKGR